MHVTALHVRQFRNHKEYRCRLAATVNVIYGSNGSGKTSLLEAICLAYKGTSFRGHDKDMVHRESEWYRVSMSDTTNIDRVITFDNRGERARKQWTVDSKSTARLPQKFRYPVILFTPDDLRLIDGSPARRRKYLDDILSQLNPTYHTALRRYERALVQRNRLLKSRDVSSDQLFPWNVILSESGSMVISTRRQFVKTVNDSITQKYQQIAGAANKDEVSVEHTAKDTSAHALLSHYEDCFERDRLQGYTTAGPHRHDIQVSLRGTLAENHASRGEVRTIILALKYIEADMIAAQFGMSPLILLDDVFGELDSTRQQHLIETFNNQQIIITSTHPIEGIDFAHQIRLAEE